MLHLIFSFYSTNACVDHLLGFNIKKNFSDKAFCSLCLATMYTTHVLPKRKKDTRKKNTTHAIKEMNNRDMGPDHGYWFQIISFEANYYLLISIFPATFYWKVMMLKVTFLHLDVSVLHEWSITFPVSQTQRKDDSHFKQNGPAALFPYS